MDFKLNKSNLNFRVKTAETMPDNSGANDFVIISPTPMKNWIMTPEMPTKAPRNDGDVCIPYSVNGNVLNVVKDGSFMIAPLTALQYANDAWKGVSAMVFPGGKKAKFLYNAGNECEELTGGWVTRAWSYSTAYTSIVAPTLTKKETGFTAVQSSGSTQSGVIEVQNDVDLTNVNSITFDFSSIVVTNATSSYIARLTCAVLPRTASRYYTNATKAAEKTYTAPANEKDVTITIDVSDLSGSYDIIIGLAIKNSPITIDCRSVRMEVV